MAKIIEITIQEYLELSKQQPLLICDIREISEYNHEHIEDAHSLPLSSLDIQKIKLLIEKELKIPVFHCQAGTRTKNASQKFAELDIEQVYILQGGINAWKQAGLVIIKNHRAPLPIMRQVQIVAGSLIVLGVLLAYLVHPAFILLSAFVGCGLIFAGVSGFCGLANLLMLLPFNLQPTIKNKDS